MTVRRRIVGVGLITALLALVLFAVPLAVAVRQLYLGAEHNELERAALRAAVSVNAGFTEGDPVELVNTEPAISLALYDGTGTRVAGTGPPLADDAVRAALRGQVTLSDAGGSLSVAVPVSSKEAVIGAIRAASPAAVVRHRTALTWAGMCALAALAIGVAVSVAWRQATRLTRPVHALTDAARQLGDGDFELNLPPSGIPELDSAAAALRSTSRRLGELIARERAFAANASHQLRTPLTGLRLRLESAQAQGHDLSGSLAQEALVSVDRLEETISDLIALGRPAGDAPGRAQPVETILEDLAQRWHGHLAAVSRRLDIRIDPGLPRTTASPPALRQILDVLVDNSLRHGSGTVTVHAREVGPALGIDVTDDGPGIDPSLGDVFRRGVTRGGGEGIGLAMAADLARDQAGRLVLTQTSPSASFTLLLPTAATET